MVCIYCHSKTRISNSRPSRKTMTVWRRHQCTQCRAIFTTRETPDLINSLRVKTASGNLTPFLRDKLFVSVFLSVSHRKTALSDATGLTDTILANILTLKHSGVITIAEIIELSSKTLKRFDLAAYVHYTAHHK